MSEILVSVVVPVYNEEKYVDGLMEALASQTFPCDQTEWLIIDARSTDRTVEILSKYAEAYPVKILVNEKRLTPYALNIGIKAAQGKYVVRVDAHSYIAPDYVEKSVKYLDETEAACVGGLCETCGVGIIGKAFASVVSSRFGVGNSCFRIGARSGWVDVVPFGAFRREIFDKVGLFNVNLLRSEDNDMFARIRADGGKIWLADDIMCKYYCRNTLSGIFKQALQNGNGVVRTMKYNRKAMSYRHFTPLLFLTSLVVLIPFSFFYPWAACLLFAELSAYLLLDLYFSFSSKGSFVEKLVELEIYPFFHLSYGLGSFLALFGFHAY